MGKDFKQRYIFSDYNQGWSTYWSRHPYGCGKIYVMALMNQIVRFDIGIFLILTFDAGPALSCLSLCLGIYLKYGCLHHLLCGGGG